MIATMARLFDTDHQAVIGTTLSGEIVYWNRTAERIFGWGVDEVLGRNILDVTPGTFVRGDAHDIMERLRKGFSWEGEFLVKNRAGQEFGVRVVDLPVRDDTGELVGIVGTSRVIRLDDAA